MDSRDVFMFFTKFGPVEYAKAYYGKSNSKFAFVTFESRETSEEVLKAEKAELTLRNGKYLKVGAARSKEIKSQTWERSKRFPKPWDSDHAAGVDQGAQVLPGQFEDGVQQQQLPHADLQLNPSGAGVGLVPMAPQYLLFNNNYPIAYNNSIMTIDQPGDPPARSLQHHPLQQPHQPSEP